MQPGCCCSQKGLRHGFASHQQIRSGSDGKRAERDIIRVEWVVPRHVFRIRVSTRANTIGQGMDVGVQIHADPNLIE